MESYLPPHDKYKPTSKRDAHNNNSTRGKMEKRMPSSPSEEEDVFACLSFRNLAVGSNLCSSSISSSSSSDGTDLEFEFLPSAELIHNRGSFFFYPIFRGTGDSKRAEEIPESKVEEEEEEEILTSKTNCLWSTGKKMKRRGEGIEKCRSTGSGSSRPWRLRDLVMIGRSRSDGNEKLLLQSPTRTTTKKKKDVREDRRRMTFLPYRSEVVSLFPARRILPRRKFQ